MREVGQARRTGRPAIAARPVPTDVSLCLGRASADATDPRVPVGEQRTCVDDVDREPSGRCVRSVCWVTVGSDACRGRLRPRGTGLRRQLVGRCPDTLRICRGRVSPIRVVEISALSAGRLDRLQRFGQHFPQTSGFSGLGGQACLPSLSRRTPGSSLLGCCGPGSCACSCGPSGRIHGSSCR